MQIAHNAYQRESATEQLYKYNGKELQPELGLNWTDCGTRMYDAATGRFTKIDRLVENYIPVSPYGYAASNPVSNVDVNKDYITIMRQDKDGIVPLGETQAVGFENYLRASFNESNYNSVRQTYTSKFLNINATVRLEEFRYQRVWPQYGLGWTTPWNITDFVNKKYVWKNLRNVAIKKYTSN